MGNFFGRDDGDDEVGGGVVVVVVVFVQSVGDAGRSGSGLRTRAAHTNMLMMADAGRPLGAWP